MIYRKRPIEVEARNFTESNGAELAEWCGGEFLPDPMKGRGGTWGDYLLIPDKKEGTTMKATPGDWIIKEPFAGQEWFYTIQAEIFEDKFEPVGVS